MKRSEATYGAILPQKKQRSSAWLLKTAVLGLTVLTFAAMSPITAYAVGADSQIIDGITGGTPKLYDIISTVVLPICALALGWNGLKVIFGGERGVEQAKKNVLILIIVIGVVFLAPVIINEVASWFTKGSWSFG